jgi:hypothetical protein
VGRRIMVKKKKGRGDDDKKGGDESKGDGEEKKGEGKQKINSYS